MRILQGNLMGEGQKIALVASRFNELITSKLIEGAKDVLFRHGVRQQDIDLYWVPGAWELPLVAQEVTLSGKYDAVIPLGAIIRGDTPHFDYVASEVTKGLAKIAIDHRVPVVFGVLTCDNLEQALLRAGSKSGNKGAEAAMAAIEMINLLAQIRNQKGGTQIA